MGCLRIALLWAGAATVCTSSFAEIVIQPGMGDPLAGLTVDELSRFELGRIEYQRNFSIEEGLGPVFNQTSCGSCHNNPVGGAGAQQVTRFGRMDKKGGFDPLSDLGGSLLNVNAIADECLEVIPGLANVTSFRVTPGALGYGLIEAIPDGDIEALADAQPEAQRGVVRIVQPLEAPGEDRVGRFGWKAQVATVLTFSADAAHQEMGITNRLIQEDNPPQGDPDLLLECDMVADPEDQGDAEGVEFIDRVTDFQRFLAAPPQTPRTGMTGETVFNEMGCAVCHVPSFTTSSSSELEIVLRDVAIRPYSDFLLHDMGAAGDGIADGPAGVRELRTPALWGVRTRNPMWHDGSVSGGTFETRVVEAIELHGAALSQGVASATAFAQADSAERAALLAFLDSLGRREHDGDGDGDVDLADFYQGNGMLDCLGTVAEPDDACAVHDVVVDGIIDFADVDGFAAAFDGGWRDCDEDGISDFRQIAIDPTLDADQNGELDACDPCPADIDEDGDVDTNDVLMVLSAWGPCASGCPEDVDGDHVVAVNDILAVVAAWGACS